MNYQSWMLYVEKLLPHETVSAMRWVNFFLRFCANWLFVLNSYPNQGSFYSPQPTPQLRWTSFQQPIAQST